MYRKDIGRCVTVSECTTKSQKYLCDDCEQRFRKIDRNACATWKSLCKEPVSIDQHPTMEVVLFSMMARAMYISLPSAPIALYKAFNVMISDDASVYEYTTHVLASFGFIFCQSSLFDTNTLSRHRKWRVEFPFICLLKLGVTIEVVCAQVPPYFFLMPANPDTPKEHKKILETRLNDIMEAVNEELQNKLTAYYKTVFAEYSEDYKVKKHKAQKQKKIHAKGEQFIDWYKHFLPTEEGKVGQETLNLEDGPLLVFGYLGPDPLVVNVPQRAT